MYNAHLNFIVVLCHWCVVQMKDEIRRCEHLKRQTVECEVYEARTELMQLWDKCYILPEQRAAFSPFHNGHLYRYLFFSSI